MKVNTDSESIDRFAAFWTQMCFISHTEKFQVLFTSLLTSFLISFYFCFCLRTTQASKLYFKLLFTIFLFILTWLWISPKSPIIPTKSPANFSSANWKLRALMTVVNEALCNPYEHYYILLTQHHQDFQNIHNPYFLIPFNQLWTVYFLISLFIFLVPLGTGLCKALEKYLGPSFFNWNSRIFPLEPQLKAPLLWLK